MLAINSGTRTSPSAARAYLSRRCANRYARITTPEARALGCRASSIAPVLRCGKRLVNETHLVRRASPAILALYGPKPPLGSFTKSTCRPGRPSSATGCDDPGFNRCLEGLRRLLPEPTPSPRLWAASPGATPARLCEHTMRVFHKLSK